MDKIEQLLARIHRDGGHYLEEHGLDKALADADAQVVEWLSLQERLAAALFVLGMVDKNNRIVAGEKGKAWNGRFVAQEVRRLLALAQAERAGLTPEFMHAQAEEAPRLDLGA